MKQTAVEYLVQKLESEWYLLGSYKEEIEKAKAIEKDQLDIRYLSGSIVGILAGIAIGFLMFG